ncbi:methyl-accepting chemotaxis protein [Clostridium brassicae]|nr:methyl-accepting chemotaxis protein [Clostridium brassicae]
MSVNEDFKTNEEILAAFKLVLPYINKIIHDDMVVGLTDLEKYIGYHRANDFELDLPEGKPIEGIDTIKECIKYKKETFADVPREVYGREIKTIFTPIYGINNEVIGTLSSGIDFNNNKRLIESVSGLAEVTEQVNKSIRQVAESATNLANAGQSSIEMVGKLNDKKSDTAEILQFIRNISAQTNLLGLNAAIESARAGEYGRGFSVVASEVRKLAEQSQESVKNIEKILEEMNGSINHISNNVGNIGAISEEQAAVTEEVLANVDQINNTVEDLKNFVQRYK